MPRQWTALAAAALWLAGCTVVNTAKVPSERRKGEIFVSAGDIPEPYESLGVLQAKRGGLRLFGFWDVVGTDLQAGLSDLLIPEIRALGGDGAINVRFHQTQYTPAAQVVGLILFFVPLPTQVVIHAEVVRLK